MKLKMEFTKIDLGRYANCISVKFTVQQCGKDVNMSKEEQVATIREAITMVCKAQDMEIIGICHYDEQTSSYNNGYEVETITIHAHLMIKPKKRTTVLSIISKLAEYGIIIDRQRDQEIIGQIKVINLQKHMDAYEYYDMLHQTEEAKEDGKRFFEESEIITNLSCEQILQLKECYNKNFNSMDSSQVKITKSEIKASLLEQFLQYGEQGKNIDAIMDKLPIDIISNDSLMKKLKNTYSEGLRRYSKKDHDDLVKVPVYIYGPADCGKSYGTIHSLKKLSEQYNGCSPLKVNASAGTGKTDNVSAGESLVYDDTYPKGVLDLADDGVCYLYRRGYGNPIFNGRYLVLTSNKRISQFFDYMLRISEKEDGSGQYNIEVEKAINTRFYIIRVNNDGTCNVEQRNTRGTEEKIKQRNEWFNKFYELFSASIADYYKTKKKP